MRNEGKRFVVVRLERSESSRAHLVDREELREVAAGAHTKFVPKWTVNEPDATSQVIAKQKPVRTLCEQSADPVTLGPKDAILCMTCVSRAGAGKICAAAGFRE